MTARTPLTMSAEREFGDRKIGNGRFNGNADGFVLEAIRDAFAELDAEREVSRKLAEALGVYADPRNFVEGNDWVWVGNDDPKEAASAALAQYTATQLASSEGLPTDTVPSQGGRD